MQEIDNFQEARIQTMEYTEFGIPYLLQTFHHDKKQIFKQQNVYHASFVCDFNQS
jgi:hypothetical protein